MHLVLDGANYGTPIAIGALVAAVFSKRRQTGRRNIALVGKLPINHSSKDSSGRNCYS